MNNLNTIEIKRIVQIGHQRNIIAFFRKPATNDLNRILGDTPYAQLDNNESIVQLGNENVVCVLMGDKLPLNILVGDTVVVYVPPECNGRPRVFVCEQRGPDNQIVTQCHLKSTRIFERRRFANFRRPCCHVTKSVLLPAVSGSSKIAEGRHTTLTPRGCDVLTIQNGATQRTHPRGCDVQTIQDGATQRTHPRGCDVQNGTRHWTPPRRGRSHHRKYKLLHPIGIKAPCSPGIVCLI